MDTTRADRLGCYGNTRGLTPSIDRLAASGVRFEKAYAHAPWTLPSTASLLTSRIPTAHGAGGRIREFSPLGDNVVTVAERFRDAGFGTAAIINVLFLSERFGLTRGFDHVDFFEETTNEKMRPASDTTDAAIQWMTEHADKPFFAMVHYFDPHLTYSPPSEYRRRFADPQDRASDEILFGKRRDMVELRMGKRNVADLPIKRMEKLYDGEIAYMDSQIARLIQWLRDMGLMDHTIVVLTSDHGEEFLEHQGYEHGHTLYDELLHVPLVFLGADVPGGVTVSRTVGLMDVAPTLLHLAGLQVPDSFRGQRLTPAFEGAPLLDRAILSEGNMWGPSWHALRYQNQKVIVAPMGNRSRLMFFDLATDPTESRNTVHQNVDIARQMRSDIEVILKSASVGANSTPLKLTDEELNRLESLGYVKPDDE